MSERFSDAAARERALELLRSGGVVVLPTDTLPGFHAMASRREAVARISRVKGAEGERRYLLLAASLDMAEAYVSSWGCVSRELLERVWPAPLTVVLPAGGRSPQWLGETVALRVPASGRLRGFVARCGEALVSTSCNRSGEPPMRDWASIEEAFDVDLVLEGEVGGGPASTLVDAGGEYPVVVREGAYDWAAATGGSNPSK
jgi:L-threonylcarbamoyladenylate synthase